MRLQHTLRANGPDDGLWAKLDGHTVYVLEVTRMERLVHLDPSASHRHGRYNVQAGTVFVPSMEAGIPLNMADMRHLENMHNALASCSWAICPSTANVVNVHTRAIVRPYGKAGTKARKRWILCVAECMWDYGARTEVCDISGNNRKALVCEARGMLL